MFIISNLSLTLVGKTRNLSRVEHTKGASMGKAPALTANIRLGWRGLPGPNTSLLQAFVNYDRKKFCILDLGRRFNQA